MTDQGSAGDRAERTELLEVLHGESPAPRSMANAGRLLERAEAIMRVQVVALVSVIVSSLSAVGASLGAMAVMSGQAPVLPDVVRVECVAPATPPAK